MWAKPSGNERLKVNVIMSFTILKISAFSSQTKPQMGKKEKCGSLRFVLTVAFTKGRYFLG